MPNNEWNHQYNSGGNGNYSMHHPQQYCPPGTRDPYNDQLCTHHSETIGSGGPAVSQDTVLHEELETFVHSKRVERAVHVKGFGAFGYFVPYQSMTPYTRLCFLQNPNVSTAVAVRFSLAVSTRGTPDSSRNVRGFATKFYAAEGNFDLLCNHIPVFLVRDAVRFPESIKAFLPSPVNNLIDPQRFWDFVSRAPEATNFVTWLYSDWGTRKSLIHMSASSVNTYVWVNAKGQRTYVKYHWLPLAGEEMITAEESARLAGENPDIAGQELYDTIQKGLPVEYELHVQMMNPSDAECLPYDPLDDTKVWSQTDFPLVPVGRMTLNQNPDNYETQVENIAFAPGNLLDGVEFSNDKMLQGRTTVYWDAQRYRLGPHFRDIPVNREQHFTPDQLVTSGLGTKESGELQRSDIDRQDDFAQAGERYHCLSQTGKEHLVENIAADLAGIEPDVRHTVLCYFQQASEEFACAIIEKIKEFHQKS